MYLLIFKTLKQMKISKVFFRSLLIRNKHQLINISIIEFLKAIQATNNLLTIKKIILLMNKRKLVFKTKSIK